MPGAAYLAALTCNAFTQRAYFLGHTLAAPIIDVHDDLIALQLKFVETEAGAKARGADGNTVPVALLRTQ